MPSNTKICPIFDDSVVVCFSSDNNYAMYLCVAIQSLIDNSSSMYNYEIYIIDGGILDERKMIILNMQKDNIKISFILIDDIIDKVNKQYFANIFNYPDSVFYRLFITSIFSNFNKVIYLDSDIIVLDDIEALYSNHPNGKIISASFDIGLEVHRYKNTDMFKLKQNILKLKNLDNYINSGVIVFDIKKCLEFGFENKCLLKMKEFAGKTHHPDQDVINAIFSKEDIDYINIEWNCFPNLITRYPDNLDGMRLYNKYIEAYFNPKIAHYGWEKPWNNLVCKRKELFWKYARKTEFYEEIIFQNIESAKISFNNFESEFKNKLEFLNLQILEIPNNTRELLNKNFEEIKYSENWFKLFGICNSKDKLKIVIFGISIVFRIGPESINKMAWWIPIRKWRDDFRKKFE